MHKELGDLERYKFINIISYFKKPVDEHFKKSVRGFVKKAGLDNDSRKE